MSSTTVDGHWTVSHAATKAGTTRKAIRLYEAKGLLPPTGRTEAGYRLFGTEDIEVLRFIRRARGLGLSLSEIGDILELQRGGEQPCDHVIAVLDEHLYQIDKTIEELTELRSTLNSMRARADEAWCTPDDGAICRIIQPSQGIERSSISGR